MIKDNQSHIVAGKIDSLIYSFLLLAYFLCICRCFQSIIHRCHSPAIWPFNFIWQ